MTDLPDLDTTNIGYIAYWNAIDDGGVGSIDPEEVLSSDRIEEYTLYDNGIHIDKYRMEVSQNSSGQDNWDQSRERVVEARIKTDGWIIVYLDGTEDTGSITGPFDIHKDWSYLDSNNSAEVSPLTLERAIDRLASELDNYGSMTVNYSDMGLYNYDYESATATTLMAWEDYSDTSNPSGEFSYTSGTTIHAAYAYGSVRYGDIEFEGVTIASVEENGALELLDNGLIPDADTSYAVTITNSQDFHTYNILVIWE